MFFLFKQKTADEMRIRDWSSDVCSSDLATARQSCRGRNIGRGCCRASRPPKSRVSVVTAISGGPWLARLQLWQSVGDGGTSRSEASRVGKECVDLGGRRIMKKKMTRTIPHSTTTQSPTYNKTINN